MLTLLCDRCVSDFKDIVDRGSRDPRLAAKKPFLLQTLFEHVSEPYLASDICSCCGKKFS